MNRSTGRRLLLGAAAAVCAATTSCREPNYRTEITPDGPGTVQVRRLPLDTPPPEPARPRPPAYAVDPAPPDPDFAAVSSAWPKLSPDDRRQVADIARRLAQPHP